MTKKVNTKAAQTASEIHGPSVFSRDEFGLLQNIKYTFNPDGSVNWRAMIKDEHLFPNRSWFDARKKTLPSSAEGLGDHQLLIKLGGIKELAKLRGFSNCRYSVERCEKDHVSVQCYMTFIPNYETNNQSVEFSEMANATLNNTSSFAQKFLETIACNRAFVRCVRNFLNVHIVGDDEIDKSDTKVSISPSNPLSPYAILQSHAKEKLACSSFDDFREQLRILWQEDKYRNEDVKKWKDWEDIPAKEIRKLLAIISDQ